ncbi:MAG: cysteine--tRNA ligase [Candidatus Saccharibacteria bacterium]|nr:cysteine--tRNA ligase [Candidatus Saccharibacteria bacterium]
MKLYNTLTRQKDTLQPLDGQTVKIYTCGLTVYSQPHIGNWVGYIYWDVLVRLLRHQGISVVRTQNITDVGHLTSDGDTGEDKLEKGARREGKTAWDVAQKYIEIAEHEAYDILGLIRPDHLVRATDYIPQQIAFARKLEAKGFTYIIEGDGLYFDTSKLANYGQLARLDVDGLEAGARVCAEGKKNITDFAIWKFSPQDTKRDMEWDSPWGKGFPGWHLECSVIARETLGDQIDIHTGGIDHIPVHHINEIAQTESVTGVQFAQMWLHNNHIKVDGRKMSKSLGNIITLEAITARGFSPMAFKAAILGKHFQTEGNFTWDILDAAAHRYKNWQRAASLRHQVHSTLEPSTKRVPSYAANQKLIEILNDNLATPQALAHIDTVLGEILEAALADIDREALASFVTTIDEVLGLELASTTPDITDEQKQLLITRRRARDEKDWPTSDRLRDELAAQGIAVRDTPHTTIWEYL